MFIEEMEESVVLSVSMSDVIDGSVKMPFTGHVAWNATQFECPNLMRSHAHLTRDTPFQEDDQSGRYQEISEDYHLSQSWSSEIVSISNHHASASLSPVLSSMAYTTRQVLPPVEDPNQAYLQQILFRTRHR